VLLPAPPGSGKTATLTKAGIRKIIDVRKIRGAAPILATASQSPSPSQKAPASTGQQAESSDTKPDWVNCYDYSILPDLIGIDHFEHRLGEPGFRNQMLRFLEELLFRQERKRNVWIACVREPLRELQERAGALTDASRPTAAELDRWTRVFALFQTQYTGVRVGDLDQFVGTLTKLARDSSAPPEDLSPGLVEIIVAECGPTPQLRLIGTNVAWGLRNRKPKPSPEDLMAEIGNAADSYYRAVWCACSRSEKLALRQLAEEGVVNPRNQAVLTPIMQDGLIVREPTFRVMNETFRRFILGAVSPDIVAAWEREGVLVSWGTIRATVLTVALGLGAILVLTQEQLLNAWIGYVATLAASVSTVVPTVMRLFGVFQRSARTDTGAT
jgi:hypothetical protein